MENKDTRKTQWLHLRVQPLLLERVQNYAQQMYYSKNQAACVLLNKALSNYELTARDESC